MDLFLADFAGDKIWKITIISQKGASVFLKATKLAENPISWNL